MKQVLQNLSTGETEIIEAPVPQARPGHLLINSTRSLISTGTERMLVEFGRAGLLSKARQQPERLRQVAGKMATDGVLTTLDAVRSKLAQPIPLGYCNVGVVAETGVAGFAIGDRVASNGPHADVVSVPGNLAAVIPDRVTDDAAAFTVVASIGLQGIRLAQPTLGECFAVFGAGLIGLLTVQMLRAQGCRVLAVDLDREKLALARQFGAETCDLGNGEDPMAIAREFSRGAGIDGAIVTASTKSSSPISQSARMCRKRGRVILVGVTGLDLNRADFYEKEITFQVSCAYGPGRYDPAYEDHGQDYPIGFVRWTEQRNFEAVLDLMAAGAIDTGPLISHRFDFSEARRAYDCLGEDTSALGILLCHDHDLAPRHATRIALAPAAAQTPDAGERGARCGVIGAGNYAARVLIPAFRQAGADMQMIASAGGTSAAVQAKAHGIGAATSDTKALIADPELDALIIATRHDSHARLTSAGLAAGKHVFVEKPLALTEEELTSVETAHAEAGRHLMVGFNRRFAPLVTRMKRLLAPVTAPKSFVMVMNAGAIPGDHWTQDPAIGGGRIIGEACHHIDLMRFLAGVPIVSVAARGLAGPMAQAGPGDTAAILLGFADGSFGSLHYLANGGAAFPKERIEVFAAGACLQLDNFRTLKGFGWPGFRRKALLRQDKGQGAAAAAFVAAIRDGGPPPIPATELFEVSRITLNAAAQLRAQI